MKNVQSLVLLSGLLASAVVSARADDKNVPAPPAPSHEEHVRIEKKGERVEKMPVTFLGVETSPTGAVLAEQLGLPAEFGLVVTHVVSDSAAASALKKHDILTKIDDQILVDSHQLGVLVRSHKEGDEVTLTFIRGGKELSQKVKLGAHEHTAMIGFDSGRPESDQVMRFFGDENMPEDLPLHELPRVTRDDVDNALRMLGREHGQWFNTPGVRIFSRGHDKGSTMLNLKDGNFVFSDETGSVEVNAADGKRELTVKDAKGSVTFKGSIATAEDRGKLPPEVVARLDKIEKMNVVYESDDNLEQDSTAIKPPEKTKISLPAGLREIGQPVQPF